MPSIVEIAKAAQVSTKTAARILNGESQRSKHRERVLETAQRMGYVRNENAATMRTGKAPLIGLVLPYINNPFYTGAMQTVHDSLRAKNYQVLLACSFGNSEVITEVLDRFRRFKVSGMIFNGSEGAFTPEHESQMRSLQAEGRPVVLVGRPRGDLPVDAVNIDNQQAMTHLMQHLARQGRKRPAFIGGTTNTLTIQDRLTGFHAGAAAAGIPRNHCQESLGGATIEDVAERVRRLMNFQDRPDALVCFNDLTALTALKTCQEMGIRVPEDVAVTGFDDIPLARAVHPGLTTLHQPINQIARDCVDLVLSRLEEDRYDEPWDRLYQADLVVRGSS